MEMVVNTGTIKQIGELLPRYFKAEGFNGSVWYYPDRVEVVKRKHPTNPMSQAYEVVDSWDTAKELLEFLQNYLEV